LGSFEEWFAEAECHRSRHHGQFEVQEVGDRGHSSTDQGAGMNAHAEWGLGCRAGSGGLDRQSRRLGLKASLSAAYALAAFGLYHHVANVPRVAMLSIKQPAVDDDPATNAR
jgi:hypothetical protein